MDKKDKSMREYMQEYWESEKKETKESYRYFFVFVGILILDIILIIGTKIETLSIIGWTGVWFLFVLAAISLRDMYRHKEKADNIYNLLMKVEIEKVKKEQEITFKEINEEISLKWNKELKNGTQSQEKPIYSAYQHGS